MSEPLTGQQIRDLTAYIAEEANEYAGIPLSIQDQDIVVHKSYRFAEVFHAKRKAADLEHAEDDWQVVNRWPSLAKPGHEAFIMRNRKTGQTIGGLQPLDNRLTMQFMTFGCVTAWTLAAERKALDILGRMLKPHAFRCYMLTGGFLETSLRSRVTYFFRRLRPTLAIKADERGTRALCALCLHPIGYYASTWAGVMVPTDEIVAHLTLMRGDEPDFWRQANQHPAWMPASGL